MGKKNWGFLAMVSLLMILALAGCSGRESGNEEKASTEPKLSKELKVAFNAQPATLDNHINSNTATLEVSRNIFEKLFEFDSKYKVVPMLAESAEESEDGKTVTFHLRKGVKFHNGKEMKAEDVVASLNRWQSVSSKGKTILKDAKFSEIDEYTVELKLPNRIYGLLSMFADVTQSAIIMPKEIAEEAGTNAVTEYIGTGPFKFEEWVKDQYIHLTKFEDYTPMDLPSDGLSGKKEALVNDVYFYIVPDSTTRIAGLQTGEYDIGTEIPREAYDQIANAPNLEYDNPIKGAVNMIMNKKEGVFSNIKIRQAVNAALDLDSILMGAYSNEKFYRLESSWMLKEQAEWYSEAGKEKYNLKDPELAKSLLKEAGYDGTPVRLLTSRDYDYMYNSAIIIAEQLKNIGMVVDLQVYEWATIVEKRGKPEGWDAFVAAAPSFPTPTQILWLGSDWPGWTDDPKIEDLMGKIDGAATQEEAFAAWDELQGYLYEYLPTIKIGDTYLFVAYSDKVKNFRNQDGIILWNTSKEE
ncbi:ABC transporter substrate-binding protein [Cytobacillus depressus]|uniref:ABC transporter substrate-binding protein n=1 Tax=Cytobacillus depressus TaxID=1602942 RepID=A0A6L3V6B1_9BACI|nr:ABC transporter substrate-binding protein [Cytobacillus depressus]KAB2331493.1 ABC transporter substrate-binding protein [Cytobacillus depressus]